MTKLNQMIAIEKGIKNQTHTEVSELYKAVQKPELFDGFNKSYTANDAEGERIPDENKRVQFTGEKVLADMQKAWGELFNITARKDWTNTEAKSDIVIDGAVIVADVPVTYLLFLEKNLTDIRTILKTMPTLSEADSWGKDENSGLYKTAAYETHRTKKVQKPLCMAKATDKHPEQAVLITEDVITGYWSNVKLSGALPRTTVEKYLTNAETMLRAVKQAREAANMQEEVAPPGDVGKTVFGYLFK